MPRDQLPPESMKLCVKPKSSKASSWTPFTTTISYIVLLDHVWMPVSACSEIVGSAMSVLCSSSSSMSTSVTNNCLQTDL
jgi:hypothetical protein